ncbi:hypothetical protein BANRA_01928 [Acinetobacter baumannii]|nr:hypothetical protein BANRA_01928 [Acinetobacter baumannii]VCX50095.1 hypothetical protein BANRA_04006 [Acinetobacter baumannii]
MLGSYGLKHMCEDYYGEICGQHTYISNGALIIGAILNNFNFEQYSEYHINCSFNISKKVNFTNGIKCGNMATGQVSI